MEQERSDSDECVIDYPSEKRKCREEGRRREKSVGYPENENPQDVLHQYPIEVQRRVEIEKEKKGNQTISQRDNTVLHPRGFFLIDYMYVLSNVFLRINRLLAGELPEGREKRRAKEKEWMIISNTFYGESKLIPGKVGSIVNAMAMKQLTEICGC